MRTLEGLTQTRLAAFLINQTAGSPLERIPVYGELAVYKADVPTVSIVPFRDIVPEFEMVHSLLEQAIANKIGAARYAGLPEEERRRIVEKLVDVIRSTEGFFGLTRQRQQELLDRTAEEIAGSLDGEPAQFPAVLMTRIPLGFLATDHAGFVSFDLEPSARRLRALGDQVQVSAHLYPLGREEMRLDVLEQGRITSEFMLAKLELKPLNIEGDIHALQLPALQNPGLLDWYLSPASFTAHPKALVGQDGCEHLFPANFSLQDFVLRQMVRLRDRPPGPQIPPAYKMGYIDEYRVSFAPLGHSLGQILYSLPLAPGETVKLAVIDWSWSSDTTRTEATRLYEDVLHETHRDRTITETVKAGLQEFQTGSTFMGGIAGAGGASASLGVVGGAAGIAGSLGGSTASSSGSRELAAQNVQRLVDSFSQASSAQRELQSTVVIHARQEQTQSIQTRTFSNYNHSHTLTILYYEVLRHYRLVTEWVRRRPVLLRPMGDSIPKLANDANLDADLLSHRRVLESVLLEPRWKPGFDAIEKLAALNAGYERLGILPPTTPVPGPVPFSESGIRFTLFELIIKTKDGDLTADKVVLWAIKRDGVAIQLELLYFGPHANEEHESFDNSPQNINSGGRFDFDSGSQYFFVRVKTDPGQPPASISWGELAGFQFEKWGTEDWRIDRLGIRGFDKGGIIIDLLPDTDVDHHVIGKEPSSQSVTFIKRPAPDPPAAPHSDVPPQHRLSPEEFYAAKQLRAHIAANAPYYRRALALARPSEAYALEFENESWIGSDKLIDHALPTPLEVFGNYAAFAFTDEEHIQPDVLAEIRDDIRSNDPVRQQRALERLAALSDADLERMLTRLALAGARAERLISLPTRGVFAEGKLGHCNISEEIDNNRFWKWEEHPIPIEAPGINPVTPITPTPQAVTVQPTPFPSSLVNIVSPAPAPDPTGLSDALKLLGTPNIFRDMSGRAEVADLLKKLVDGSIEIAEASKRAKEIETKYGSASAATAPGAGSGETRTPSGGATPRPATRPTSAELHDDLQLLRNAELRGDIAPEDRQDLAKSRLQAAFKIDSASVDLVLPPDPLQPWWVTKPLPGLDDFDGLIADAKALINAQIPEYSHLWVPVSRSTLSQDVKQALAINLIRVTALARRMEKIKERLERDWVAAGKTPAQVAEAANFASQLDLWSTNIKMIDYSMVPVEAHVFDPSAKKQRLLKVSLTDRTTAEAAIISAYMTANP